MNTLTACNQAIDQGLQKRMDLRILHVSTFDSGGAATAAYRIHKGLLDSGIKSQFYTLHNKKNNRDVISYFNSTRRGFISRVINKVREVIIGAKGKFYFYGAWQHAVGNISEIDIDAFDSPNVIMLHWISGFTSLDVILQLKKKYNAKVYWYLMDMAPMTGGCHFAWDCMGYTKDCSNCPATKKIFDSRPKIGLQHKRQVLKELDIEIVSGTSWLTKQARQSSLFQFSKIHDVLLGINEDVFKPLDAKGISFYKEKYKLDKSKRIIAFGASKISDERKGFEYLLIALKILFSRSEVDASKYMLVSAGVLVDQDLFLDIEHVHIGYLGSDIELASLYQMSDVFVSPAIEDSGPMMINESIMCGTPVVSFNMGVATDLVKENETGYIAELKNSQDLALGIEKVLKLNDSEYNKMRDNCRNTGIKKTSVSVQIDKINHILQKPEVSQ